MINANILPVSFFTRSIEFLNDDVTTVAASFVVVGLISLLFFFQSKAPLPKGTRYPPHVVSWIPFLGSALEMNQGLTREFIHKYARKFNSPAFTATIAGRKCLFIADSQYIPMVWKDTKEIDDLALQRKFLMNVLGLTEKEADITFAQENKGDAKMALTQIHNHVLSKDLLSGVLRKAQDYLLQTLNTIFTAHSSEGNMDEWIKFRMFDFVRKTVFKASIGPLISTSVATDEVFELFLAFDAGVPLLFGQAPSFMTKKVRKSRQDLLALFLLPEFLHGASPLMKERDDTLYMPKEMLARMNLALFWGSVGNSLPGVFWTLYNIISDPLAYNACRGEVLAVVARKESSRDWFTMDELDQMPVLHSAFQESLRMYHGLFSVREVVKDFLLNPKESSPTTAKYMIKKGTNIMALPNVMHYDPDIFKDPNVFQYDRFLDPTARSLKGNTLLSSHLRPFGGGAHLCPGRKFIAYESQAFLAMMFVTLDMRLVEGESRPGILYGLQGISVAHPDRDPKMEVRVRKAE